MHLICGVAKLFNLKLTPWSKKLLAYLLLVAAFPRGWFVEQKLVLSSTFCHQIHNCQRHDFGHTFLCYLSHT